MKKINNKILIVALVVLIGIFVLSRVFRTPQLESNVRKELVKLDSASITEVRITPSSSQNQLIKMVRDGKRWSVQQENKKFDADQGSVKSLLGTLTTLEAERMVSRKKDKWETFNVGEKGTGVSVYYGSDLQADFRVGKTGFSQATGNPNPYGGFGGNSFTYVRLSDEDEVYTVNGFLESSFNRSLNDWRDKSFLRIPRDLATKITFTYSGDSSFVLEKKDTLWYAANQKTEQSKVDSYLGQLSFKNLNTFEDNFSPSVKADVVIQVQSAGGSIGIVEAWKKETNWVLKSALQPTVYFSSSGSSVDRDLFVTAEKFLKE